VGRLEEAFEAVFRGGRFDQGDFAGFTSQESSNLVWGGIKYLESGELGPVTHVEAEPSHARAGTRR